MTRSEAFDALAFAGRQTLVTGAASGIGAALSERLLALGAQVAAVDLQPMPERPGLTSHSVDVTDETAIEELVRSIVAGGRLQHVFNVAGIGSTASAPETSVATWDRVFAVNSRGTFVVCKHAIPPMAASGGGTIVNMGSIAGLVGLRNRAAYCASKGAVIALTRALAVDHVAEGIRVNCVCPGTVDSPWVRRLVDDAGESLDALRARQPMGRLGSPEEIADAALYLASDAADFITGSVLTIDGGLTAA
jgi:NAD(P)-dependent dehydrogenase (short-subunit alcohol dehydrogenase family)